MSSSEESSSIHLHPNRKSEVNTSADIVVGESSYEDDDSSATEDEVSTIRYTRKKKNPIRIESDDSESEVSRANIENSESSDDDESEGPHIENDDSENEIQKSPTKHEDEDSEKKVQKSSSKNKSKDFDNAIQNNDGNGDKLKTIEGRPSMWEENDLLSSTRIYRPSEAFENHPTTPKQMGRMTLKESFLTPREVKRLSISDSEDEDSTELVILKEESLKKSFENQKQSPSRRQPRKSDIIEVSSDEEIPPPKPLKPKLSVPVQTKLDVFAQPFVPKPAEVKTEPTTNYVTQEEYKAQKDKVFKLEQEWTRNTNILRTVNLSGLPDKGELLLMRHDRVEKSLKEERDKFERMVVRPAPSNSNLKEKILSSWDAVQQATDLVQPRTFGKQAMATVNAERALTMELLSELHSSLKTCPDENTFAEDPKGLKVELMPHQKRALAWLLFRETQKPAGGILADDMGLGKTLTMISLVLKEREQGGGKDEENEQPNPRSKKYRGGTLVVCPASLANQWEGEVARMTKRGLLDVEVYHGPKRERKPKRLAAHDLVVTTYSIIQNEHERNGTVFGVKWHRIILDEAHQIRNHKSLTSLAVCQLSAKKRWALTGTPVHNKEEDMYALLKFLRCTPFDDLAVWKRWIANKNTGGQNRLSAVISSLLLRRTKADLQAAGALNCLPKRNWELITVDLDKQEMDIYHKVLVFSRTLFAQFLHQRAEKQEDARALSFTSAGTNSEYFKMHQKLVSMNRVKEIKQHHILVLLLRLRQICCHPCLITSMLEDIDGAEMEETEDSEELNILEQLKRLELEDDHYDPAVGLSEGEPVGLAEASKGILNPSHPVFSKERRSSKMKVVLQVLKDRVLSTGDKAIIVSQWTSLLQLMAQHLKSEGIQFNELNGSIPVHKRMCLVDDFNNPNHPVKVMLLSLTAGGVGLNLVGGNHLFLVDLHWNPQLEMQAQDRIYRVGQKKQVNVYKFMTVETIEERIKKLQDNKLAIADSMLTGSKIQSSKLTLTDLKMLFGV